MAVRREKVLLELEDRFSNPMLRAAAATQTLDKSLTSLDGSTVRADKDMDRLGGSSGSLSKTAVQSRNLNREIDRTSGRLRLLVDAAVLLGPALVPIGAVAVPAIAGLASAGAAATLGIGTMVAAFQGVGTALEAVNEAALEPTSENLAAAREAMMQLSPAARDMVRQLQDMRPAFEGLRDAAAEGLFPGLSTALGDLDSVLPRVERILTAVGDAAGDVTAEFASGIAGPRGREFLSFIQAEMPGALTDLGRTAGNVAAGMAEMWQAFTPLNNDFSDWLLGASRAFDDWASGLSQTRGFQDFVAYIRENGPRVADAMGAIGNAVLQIVEAAAPLGGPTLAALEAVANVIGAIADSSYGPALVALASGIALVSRSMKALDAIKASSLFTGLTGSSGGAASSLTRMQGAGVAAAAGLTAAFAAGSKLVDLFREDLPGVEQLTGMLLDLRSGDISSLPAEFDSLATSIERITNPSFLKGQATSDTFLGLFGMEGRTLTNATDEVEALESALMNVLAVEGYQASESAFRVLAEDAGLTADEVAKLRDLMPGYTDALAGAQRAAVNWGDRSSAAARRAAQGFTTATNAAESFRNAVAALNRMLEGRANVRDYRRALDDFTKGLRENGRSFDTNTEKGRRNQENLDNILGTLGRVVDGMKKSERQRVLSQARADILDLRDKGKLTQGQVEFLMAAIRRLDGTNANPQINGPDSSSAISNIHEVLNAMNQLDGTSATVTTYYETVGRSTGNFDRDHGRADGGTIYGQRYPYRDKVLTMLAPGEEVISNRSGQADRHRSLLKAINAGAYANGGTVAPNVSVAAPNVNVNGRTQVFLDSREIRAVVRSEIAKSATYDRMLEG